MTHEPTPRRRAVALCLAVAALPAHAFAQDVPPAQTNPPPVIVTPVPAPAQPVTQVPVPSPPVLTVDPVPLVTPNPAPTPVPTPPVAEPEPEPRAAEPAPRAARRSDRAAALARSAPAPASDRAAPAAASAVAEPVAAPAPVAAPLPPAAVPIPVDSATIPTSESTLESILPWLLAGAALLVAAIALLAWRRRRTAGSHAEAIVDRDFAESEPAFAPAALASERVGDADADDIAALAATSAPAAGRPWLEFMMRPVRAGTSADQAIVQFELTIANTGAVRAAGVRITTGLMPGDATEMERSLILPSANAMVNEVDIEAGEAALVEGEVAIARSELGERALPIVVADARYRLPDGGEGRTFASFAVGLPEGDALAPFPVDRASGLREDVEARLYGDPERA